MVSSPVSEGSTSSSFSTQTERPRRTSSSPSPIVQSPSSMSGPSVSGEGSSVPPRAATTRPSLLRPPATIISPPSPIEPTTGSLPSPLSVPTTASPSEVCSPVDTEDQAGSSCSTPPPARRPSPADRTGSYGSIGSQGSPRPIAATSLSLPPRFISPASHTVPLPPSPGPSTPGAGRAETDPHLDPDRRRESLAVPMHSTPPAKSDSEGFFCSSPFASPSLPMPSSPHFHPKRLGHRRESSTHRVKETPNGMQRSTDDGEIMVNQYRIGKGLGRGGFAKVELAVDVGTGKEYAIKEFSKSRLHTQSLQEKQRQNTRGKMLRGRGRGRGGTPARPQRRCSLSGSEDGTEDDEAQETGEGGTPAKSGNRRARAISEPDANDPLGLIRREIAVMKKLDHPNVVLLYEAISVPNADALYLVLEYMPGGVLMSIKLGEEPQGPPFDTDHAREYFRQLLLGLEYLHANGVIHRDIKPDNVLLSGDRTTVKLCDFGVSEMFLVENADDRVKKSGGSPAFLSPESFTSHTHEVHGKLVDIWALGVTLYCMLTGFLPFNTENPIELFEMVQNEEPRIPEEWPEDQKDLVRQMLRKEPTFRIHLFLLREHPWVTEDGANPMISREDNLYHVGKMVDEPTQEELQSAIGALRSVFTVIRAVQKFKRLIGGSLTSTPISSPPIRNSTLDSITSTAFSGRTSGSMDSYVSDIPTENTSMEGVADRNDREGVSKDEDGGEDDERERTASPDGMDVGHEEDGEVPTLKLDTRNLQLPEKGHRPSSPGHLLGSAGPGGESEEVAADHLKALRISTDVHNAQSSDNGDEALVFDSPSDDKDDTPQQSQPVPAPLKEVDLSDSPVDAEQKGQGDNVQITASPVDEVQSGTGEAAYQIMDSPVEDEEVPAVRDIKGRPRPRPRP